MGSFLESCPPEALIPWCPTAVTIAGLHPIYMPLDEHYLPRFEDFDPNELRERKAKVRGREGSMAGRREGWREGWRERKVPCPNFHNPSPPAGYAPKLPQQPHFGDGG